MPVLVPITVSILPSTQSSGGSLKEKANGLRYGTQASADARHWVSNAEALTNAQSQIDHISNALRRPVPFPDPLQITDPSGKIIAQIGNTIGSDNVSYPGIWAENLYVGGNYPNTAILTANGSGVTINGAIITLNANGVVTTISNAPGTVGPWTGQPTSFESTDVATGSYAEMDPFHVALVTSAGVPIVYMASTGSDGTFVVGHSPTTGQQIAMDGATATISSSGGGVTGRAMDLSPTDLIFSEASGGHLMDIARDSLTVSLGGSATTITATNVDSPSFSTSGVFGISGTISGRTFTNGLLTA